MRKVVYIALLVLVAGGLIWYSMIGGFSTPDIYVKETQSYTIAGNEFNGLMKSPGFKKAWDNAEALKKMIPNSYVAALFYKDPEIVRDSISGFIGVAIKDSLVQVPDSFSVRAVPGRKVLESKMNYMIVPPSVYNDFSDYAEENSLNTGFPVLELYPGEKQIIIQVPVEQE